MSAFDELVKNQGGELAEKFARDSGTLGALITRHISEFDVPSRHSAADRRSHGSAHQDIAESLKTYVDTFDTRVTFEQRPDHASLDSGCCSSRPRSDQRGQSRQLARQQDQTFDESVDAASSRSTSRSTPDHVVWRVGRCRIRSFDELVDGRFKSFDDTSAVESNRSKPAWTPGEVVTDTIDNRLGTLATSLTRAPRRRSLDRLPPQPAHTTLTDGTPGYRSGRHAASPM